MITGTFFHGFTRLDVAKVHEENLSGLVPSNVLLSWNDQCYTKACKKAIPTKKKALSPTENQSIPSKRKSSEMAAAFRTPSLIGYSQFLA